MRYHIGDKLEIRIEKIVPNGLGMGFGEELTVFVPLSAPGDVLVVELRQIKGRTAFAAIDKILVASDVRTDPVCPHFGVCGGCDLQHLKYDAQLEAKKEMIRDSLTRIAKLEPPEDFKILPSPMEHGYRLRTQFHYSSSKGKLGFFKRLSHEVEDIEHCPILSDGMNRVLRDIRNELKGLRFDEAVTHIDAAAVGEANSIYSSELVAPTEELRMDVFGERFLFNAKSFFQANESMIEILVETAVGGEGGETALDLYCGAGLFSIPLAKRFGSVIGIEVEGVSLEFGERNRELARVENLEFHRGRVREFFAEFKEIEADLVLLDPPRGGVKAPVLERIADAAKERIVYVSCNPSTLARDLALLEKIGFAIESLTGLDLFPQTHHVETVAKLSRR
ncbi:MAG: class I SAM-dependent RNA methyltransferase [Pyrinomonadaceae bacterium]